MGDTPFEYDVDADFKQYEDSIKSMSEEIAAGLKEKIEADAVDVTACIYALMEAAFSLTTCAEARQFVKDAFHEVSFTRSEILAPTIQ